MSQHHNQTMFEALSKKVQEEFDIDKNDFQQFLKEFFLNQLFESAIEKPKIRKNKVVVNVEPEVESESESKSELEPEQVNLPSIKEVENWLKPSSSGGINAVPLRKEIKRIGMETSVKTTRKEMNEYIKNWLKTHTDKTVKTKVAAKKGSTTGVVNKNGIWLKEGTDFVVKGPRDQVVIAKLCKNKRVKLSKIDKENLEKLEIVYECESEIESCAETASLTGESGSKSDDESDSEIEGEDECNDSEEEEE